MRIPRTVCLAVCLLLLAAPLAAEPIAQRLPHDTILLITAPDLSRSWAQFQKSTLYDIWKEPSVQAFYQKARKLIEQEVTKAGGLKKAREEFKNKVGLELEDLPAILFKGEFALALIDLKLQGKQPPKVDLLLSFDFSKEGDKFEKLLRFMLDLAVKDGGATRNKLKLGEHDVTELSFKDAPFKLHLATQAGRLYLTTAPETMKTVLAGLAPADKLSSNPLYQSARKGIDANQEIGHFYVNLEALWKRVDSELPPDAKGIMDKLGVFGIKALASGTSFDGKAISDHIYFAMPGERVGVQKLFTYPKSDLKGLKYAPADVGSFSVAGLELNAIYQEALRVFKAIDEAEFKKFEQQKKEFEEKLGMKIDDLAAALGSQMTSFTRKPKGSVEKKAKPEDFIADFFRATYVIQLKDEQTARAGIEKALKMMELKTRNEEHHGWTLTFLELPKEQQAPFKSVAWAIKDGHLFVGMPGDNLVLLAREQASGAAGLAASESFKAEMNKYPEGFAGYSYVDLAAYLRAIWTSATPYLKEMLVKGKAPIEFADLPDIEAVAKHVTPLTGASYSDQAGLRMVYRSPMGGMTTMAFVGVGAALAVPAMNQAKDRARQAACLAKLRQIGLAVQTYKADGGKYPEELAELVTGQKKYLIGEPFKCPSDAFPQREGKIETSFIYIYSNKLGDETAGKTILCYDKSPQHSGNTRNVLFLDGSVQNMSDFEFRELFKAQKERLKKHGIQVFIGWGKLK